MENKIKIEGVHFEYLPATPPERKIKDAPCLLSIEYRDECAWLSDKEIVILRDFLNQLPLTNV